MTSLEPNTLTPTECSRARFARDSRFDGLFFVAVKTTGIFCRPICPVIPPLEANVEYFDHAAKAYQAGYRPCLRCRPDSAPGSCAWRGTDTTFTRALTLIDDGALQHTDLPAFAARLGIGDRYLRQLFQQRLGLSPKAYAIFGQVMFAKQLLHETSLSMTAIATAAGFNSLRRFNDAFLKHLQLSPSAIRRDKNCVSALCITLAYRPPLNWNAMLEFWRKRCVSGIEWVDDNRYGRTFTMQDSRSGAKTKGHFEVSPLPDVHTLQLSVQIDNPLLLRRLVARVRQILDLDADIHLIEQHLKSLKNFRPIITSGLRIPGIWHPFEAGVRAILGQQVSVAAARTHLERLVHALAEEDGQGRYFFPSAHTIATSDLAMLKMPASRREALQRFAAWYTQHGEEQPVESWLQLKGIGRWTVDYVQMRALGHTDIWLAGDLGIQKALGQLRDSQVFDNEQLKPWRSYATFQLWNYQPPNQ